MNKKKALPYIYFSLFVCSLALLTATTVLGAQALPSQQSGEYTSDLQMYEIGIAIQEGDEETDVWKDIATEPGVTSNGAFQSIIDAGIVPGVIYDDNFRVKNTGTIDEYVRVVIYKYWTDNGKKDFSADAGLIDLGLSDSENWIVDEKNSTDEKTILIYAYPISAASITDEGETVSAGTTDVFLESLSINGDIKKDYKVIEKTEHTDKGATYTTIVYDYAYNGKGFKIELEADGVQTHHAEDAIKSAWGRDVSIADDGKLSLK